MADDPLDNNDPPRSRSPWASLGYRDYRLLFFVALFATTAQQMRLTQNLYQVYELSGSAFQLGLTGLAQGIPLFAFGLFGGTLADFVDRKKLLIITVAGNLLVAIALEILTLTGAIRVWHVLLGTALTSALNNGRLHGSSLRRSRLSALRLRRRFNPDTRLLGRIAQVAAVWL
jgi:MFS family permease